MNLIMEVVGKMELAYILISHGTIISWKIDIRICKYMNTTTMIERQSDEKQFVT